MIISHKYKFIFIKPTKVAGTSVEVALAKYCGPEDIITKIAEYSQNSDERKYINHEQNCKNFYNHIPPKKIQKMISPGAWSNYYKFTIVRNPWEVAVSRYFWNNWKKSQPKKSEKKQKPTVLKILKNIFNYKIYLATLRIYKLKKAGNSASYFLKNFYKDWTNEKFYFDKNGNPICDFYIRYENLEDDYKKVCEKIGIPYEKLPKLKTKQRTEKKHYSAYYDEKSKKRIAKICQKEIKYFGYQFEKK